MSRRRIHITDVKQPPTIGESVRVLHIEFLGPGDVSNLLDPSARVPVVYLEIFEEDEPGEEAQITVPLVDFWDAVTDGLTEMAMQGPREAWMKTRTDSLRLREALEAYAEHGPHGLSIEQARALLADKEGPTTRPRILSPGHTTTSKVRSSCTVGTADDHRPVPRTSFTSRRNSSQTPIPPSSSRMARSARS